MTTTIMSKMDFNTETSMKAKYEMNPGIKPPDPLSTCVICQRTIQPKKRLRSSKHIQKILSACGNLLKPDVFRSSTTWEFLSDQEKVPPLCEDCFSSGRKLCSLSDRLDAIQKEISNFVDQFTETILSYAKTDNTIYQNSDEKNWMGLDLDDVKEENVKDELNDIDTDFFVNDSGTYEMNNNGSDIIKCSNTSNGKISNTSQFQLKRLCIKLERLEDCLSSGVPNLKSRSKRKSVFKATTSIRKKSIEQNDQHFSDGDDDSSIANASYTTDTKRGRKRLKVAKKKQRDQKEVYECIPCAVKFFSEEKLESHVTRHVDKPLKCTTCEDVFLTSSSRKQHNRIVHGRKKSELVCKLCKDTFTSQYDLEVHIMAHEDEIPFDCFACHKKFSNVLDYIKHQKLAECPVNDSLQPSSCELCGSRFKSKFMMLFHLTSEHNKTSKSYNCAVCSKDFKIPSALESHLVVHTNEFPYSCDICQRPCRSYKGLQEHRKTHKATHSYQCKHCELSFNRRYCLTKHTFVVHTDAGKIFKCETCGWEFQFRDDYRRHLAIHSKSIICDVCGKSFNRNIDLKMHKRTHTGELFSCASCDKKFVSPYLLNQHVATAHGVGNNLNTNDKVKNRTREMKKKMKTKAQRLIVTNDEII